jgi:hypothetical protein
MTEPARLQGGQGPAGFSYRHTRRLFALVALGLAAAVGVRWFLIPPTFGERGHFRAVAIDEAREREPRHVGEARCASCHKKEVALHDKDTHAAVACEVCHGPGWQHAARKSKMKLPRGAAACLVCHQRLAARVSSFAQIEPVEHFRLVGVKDKSTPCTTCHDPHEPLYLDRSLAQARLHPLVHRCRDCHSGPARDAKLARPAGHPAIFECSSCHAALAKDFAGRSHRKVECRTCHLFIKQSDFAGRIIRDADPRFCLLCHRGGAFRAAGAPPSIEWPKHREEMGGEAGKRCVDCHQDKIHTLHAPSASQPASAPSGAPQEAKP